MPNLKKPSEGRTKGLTTRSLTLVPKSFNSEKQSVEAIATTEKPVQVWDWREGELINEVLRMDGCRLPASGQVPLIDSHDRYSIKNVLGSGAGFRDEVVEGFKAKACTVSYSKAPEGQSAALKTEEGHLTDFSIGYNTLKTIYVPSGETQIIGEDEYTGPVSVATEWELKELSAAVIGADDLAKTRTERSENYNKEEADMPKKLEKTQPEGQTQSVRTPSVENPDDNHRTYSEEDMKLIKKDADKKARTEAIEAERNRASVIRERCSTAGLDIADDLIGRGLSIDEAVSEIFTRMEKDNPAVGAGRMVVEEEDKDKFRAAAVDGISLRAGVEIKKPAPGFEDFRNISLLRLAEDAVTRGGGSVRGMRRLEIAGSALGMSSRSFAPASASDFPLILSNVANKRMLQAYLEAETTWQAWCNKVEASDFKPIQGLNIGTLPTLDLIDENGEYKDVKLNEFAESYCIKTFGNFFTLGRRMIVNDDLGVFLRVPQLFGAAGRRTVNEHVYALLASNPVMADKKTLFHRDRGNIMNIEGEPSHDTLSDGRKIMRGFKSPGGKAPLNIPPKYIIIGSKHETNTEIILTSAGHVGDNKSSGVKNIWNNKLTPVIDSTLDAYDEDTWYLAPSRTAANTIEVAFLEGIEEPFLDEMFDFDSDGIKFKCRLDFGVGLMSHYLVKNSGIKPPVAV